MSNEFTFDFESFVLANKPQAVTGFDYLRAIYKTENLHEDFIVWLSLLTWPEFIIIDNKVYVKELFDKERYQTLISNPETADLAHYWMNLFEVTGLFDALSDDHAQKLAKNLCDSWNTKLQKEFVSTNASFEVVSDQGTGEVFLALKT